MIMMQFIFTIQSIHTYVKSVTILICQYYFASCHTFFPISSCVMGRCTLINTVYPIQDTCWSFTVILRKNGVRAAIARIVDYLMLFGCFLVACSFLNNSAVTRYLFFAELF